MAKGKTRTSAQKDRAKDLGIQRKFGITLANRDQRIQEQGGVCKICRGPLEPPCCDHYHFRVTATRAAEGGWTATVADEQGQIQRIHHALTKKAAVAEIKKMMMPWSIRGILCNRCNRGLGYIERFFNAARCPEILDSVKTYFMARLK